MVDGTTGTSGSRHGDADRCKSYGNGTSCFPAPPGRRDSGHRLGSGHRNTCQQRHRHRGRSTQESSGVPNPPQAPVAHCHRQGRRGTPPHRGTTTQAAIAGWRTAQRTCSAPQSLRRNLWSFRPRMFSRRRPSSFSARSERSRGILKSRLCPFHEKNMLGMFTVLPPLLEVMNGVDDGSHTATTKKRDRKSSQQHARHGTLASHPHTSGARDSHAHCNTSACTSRFDTYWCNHGPRASRAGRRWGTTIRRFQTLRAACPRRTGTRPTASGASGTPGTC